MTEIGQSNRSASMTGRPNILLITTDQQHWAALGVHTPMLATPNLDRLGREGMRFDRAYCPNPLCSPSRSSIVTGTYPSTHGCWTIGTKLADDARTIGHVLGAAGYQTSLLGKAHFQPLASTPDQVSLEAPPTLRDLDFWRGFTGPYYGFDTVQLLRNHADEGLVGQHYALWMEDQGLTDWRDFFRDEQNHGPAREHSWDLPASSTTRPSSPRRRSSPSTAPGPTVSRSSAGPASPTRTRPTWCPSPGPRCTTRRR